MNDIEAIKHIKERLRLAVYGGSTAISTEVVHLALKALEKQLNGAWIPFKTEYDEDYNMDMLQGEIPDDEQEILVTDGECVWSDTFMRDGMECYLDSGNDLIITVKAWMKLPEPYKEVENE